MCCARPCWASSTDPGVSAVDSSQQLGVIHRRTGLWIVFRTICPTLRTSPTMDSALWASLARRQMGVISRRQLLGHGVGSSVTHRLVGRGQLVPLAAGVYTVRGAPLTNS